MPGSEFFLGDHESHGQESWSDLYWLGGVYGSDHPLPVQLYSFRPS